MLYSVYNNKYQMVYFWAYEQIVLKTTFHNIKQTYVFESSSPPIA